MDNLTPVEYAIVELIEKKNVIDGKKVFQKLCYFVQETQGCPLGLTFRMQRFGPYSDELDDLADGLALRSVLDIEDRGESGYRISLGENAPAGVVSSASAAIGNVLNSVGNEGGLTLELLASLHFLANRKSSSGSQPTADDLVQGIAAWKGRKFEDGFVRKNIERLQELGYIDSQ